MGRRSDSDSDDDRDDEVISEEIADAVPNNVIVTPPPEKPPTDEPISLTNLVDALTNGASLPVVRIGIVCMTKKPSSFERWLLYHTRALHVHRFYIRVEDTPELEALLTSPRWSDKVVATFTTDTGWRCWSGQTERQSNHVKSAVASALHDGVTHLLHIDDDELLYLPSGLRALQRELARAPRGVSNVHALTLEALVDRDKAEELDAGGAGHDWCPFTACRAFRHRRQDYSAYGSAAQASGKSFGVLSQGPMPMSPHHFGVDRFHSATNGFMRGTMLLPAHIAAVLHFESTSFVRWQQKFEEYARRDREARAETAEKEAQREAARAAGETPRKEQRSLFGKPKYKQPAFWFYQQSMHACERLLVAQEEAAEFPDSLVLRSRVQSAREAAWQLWSRRKLAPPSIPPPPRLGQPPIVLGNRRDRRGKPGCKHDSGSSSDGGGDGGVSDGEIGGHRGGGRPWQPAQWQPEVTLLPPLFAEWSGEVTLPPWHSEGAQLLEAAATAATTLSSKAAAASSSPAPRPLLPSTASTGPKAATSAPPSPSSSSQAAVRAAAAAVSAAAALAVPIRWAELVAQAGLSPAVAEKLVAAAFTATPTGGNESSPPNAADYCSSREHVDAVARRAGLPTGQRLRLRHACERVQT